MNERHTHVFWSGLAQAKQKAKQLTKRKKEAEEKHLARIASKVGNTPRKSIMSKQHQAAAAEPDGLTLRESMLR